MSRLSVIVVSFNTQNALRRCLASLGGADEVIVVDNASSDGSPQMVLNEFPSVVLLENAQNRGFGAANNQGIDVMTGDLALFLNSDAVAHNGALSRLRTVMEDNSVIACGGRLVNPDGTTQFSCCSDLTLWTVLCEQLFLERVFPNSRFFSPYWQTTRLLSVSEFSAHDVVQVMGACLLIRLVARFDERFFLYCEDTELCKRLSSHGRILYVPDAVFSHELGSSSQQRWMAIARYNRGKELYFLIHHSSFSALIVFIFNRVGALIRLISWLILNLLTLFIIERFRNKIGCFLRVLFSPISGLK